MTSLFGPDAGSLSGFVGVKESGSVREKAVDAVDCRSQTKSIFDEPRGAR